MAHEMVMDIVSPDGSGWLEIALATVAYFILSFLWWGPLFGKKWGAEMGMDMTEGQSFKDMAKPMALQLVGTFLLAYVFWAVTHAFTASHDGAGGLMLTNPDFVSVLMGAIFTTLGFVVPFQLGRIAWEKASWALFGINTGGTFVGLLAMGLVFMM